MGGQGGGFAAREAGVQCLAQAGQVGIGLSGGGGGVVVDAVQRLQRIGNAAQAAAGFGFGELR